MLIVFEMTDFSIRSSTLRALAPISLLLLLFLLLLLLLLLLLWWRPIFFNMHLLRRLYAYNQILEKDFLAFQ